MQICRAELQAFGSYYKSELFTLLGPFYVSSRCGHIAADDIKELIKLGGGNANTIIWRLLVAPKYSQLTNLKKILPLNLREKCCMVPVTR